MYSSDLPVEAHCMAMSRIFSEGLEENVHSIQDSLFQLQQLLTDLPHDMLDDSGDQLSNYSDCSVHEDEEQAREPWQHEGKWNDHPLITNPQNGYEQGERLYPDQFLYDRGNNHGETHASNWTDLHNEDEEKCTYEIKGSYSGTRSEADDTYLGRDGYNAPSHYQQNSVYHLPDNFRQYTNGHKQEFAGHNQQSKILNFPDAPKEHPKQFGTSEVVSGQPVESYKVTYKPYKNGLQQNVPVKQGTRRTEAFEELQREFLGTDENSSDNMQILQLQVLNKAKGRQLEELNEKLEKSTQQIRYLNHQLAMVKDEKDGLALSLQESQKLYQEGKEREVHLEGQVKSLEAQIQALAANEEKILKQSKVAEVAMESMQQQLLELQHSDSLQRAREQHETIVAALKQKYEEQVLSLEQQLDTTNSTLREQKELCCQLGEHVKQLEKTLEQIKCEKTEIINRLTRSLEESQKQCANLLQTGSVQETSQLRFQLQQAQSAQLMSKNMNKALQEELTELKEEIVLYESAAKLGVFLNDTGGEPRVDMNESYVDLGIKKVNWKKSRFHRAIQNRDKELSKDDLIIELKAELERLLNSNKMKRNQISQLQNDLKDCQRTTDKFQQLLKAEKIARESETKVNNVENHTDILWSNPSASDNLKEEIRRLREMNEALHQEIENHSSSIQNLKANEEKLKSANQDLCSQMRQMIQDFDQDKQEAIDRCERTYQQHHEDAKAQLWKDLLERHAAEKEQLIQAYEETISQLKANIEVLNKEIIAVKECYIAVCGEKDTLETTLRRKLEQEQQSKEEKLKKKLLEEKEDALNCLRTELEEKCRKSILAAKNQWLKEREVVTKQQVEIEVTLARAQWEKEKKKIKEQVIVEIGREWKHRLEEPKKIIVELKDCGSQTDQLNAACEASTVLAMSLFEKQKLELQEVLREREAGEVLKELETKLERKHCETMASQVETALTQAHAKWLQELTELEEYKANLKVERDKWEKEQEIKAAKQLSLVLSAAEEKWKKELENAEKSGARIKELEEKIISLRRELEIKKDEIPATVKAEVAKARAQCNKEKQEEIFQIQEQNERDYRSFLDDHRNKIKEVLATAKDDLVKQKNELLAQKEAEIKSYLDQKQREWTAQETKRLQEEIHQHKEKILVELEHLLGEIHEELVKSTNKECSQQDNSSSIPGQLNCQYKERLKTCLEKVYRGTVHALLEKAKQEWREKQEDLVSNLKKKVCSCMISGEEETGDKARPPMYDVGHQLEIHRIMRSQMPLQETEMEKDQKSKKRNLSCECCCQDLETKERECQDLKKKLEKTCRHLQLAVREHKAKAEQIQENERVLEALMEENSEMKTKLKDLRMCDTPPRSLSEGAISKPCASFDGLKGLEEMRAQYIKAVGKIKSDMLRYIHESKERAAEMIKAEVLRERQETARKMRKYYLICLQQLLSDHGKYEGAEKKIMNAASKLATMAKVLETPVRNTPQSKNTHSVLPLNSELPTGVEQSKRNYMHQSRPTHMESKSCGRSIAKKASDQVVQKRVPYNLRQQLDAAQAETLSLLHGRMTSDIQNGSTAKQLADTPRDAMSEIHPYEHERRNKTVCVSNTDRGLINATSITALQQAPTCVSQMKLGNLHISSNINGLSDSRPSPILFERQNERPALKEVKCYQPNGNWKTASERTQDFDVQEAPVRDEGGCTDWSSISGSLNLDSATGDTCLLYPVQKTNSNTSAQLRSYEQSSMTSLFSDEDTGPFCKELSSHETKILGAKNRDSLHCKDHQDVNSGCTSYQISEASSALVQVSVIPYSNVGKGHNQHLRKAVPDAKSFQQDSGFDSPFANLD
ncbi:centrosomal protein of 152 kDa isoform X1 [Alligator mississippiensis]|uniref:centrosomal protein of 152 kDa isoform X1 n=1 Tax=Alligator mississippiensis TaxID=8496 RepID=UPI0028775463|nr:centrosomal protein of 152 kDa isoform X1 [Alligator mississippiensis]